MIFRTRTLLSTMQWTILITGGLLIFLYTFSRIEAKQSTDANTQLVSALHGGSLSTPDGFQSLCGKAGAIRTEDDATVLVYGDTSVHFRSNSARFVLHHHTIDEQAGMNRLHCKAGR